MIKEFDTEVQHLKYRVLKEVAKHAFDGTLLEGFMSIPKIIVPGKKASMRCCIYKERAIVEERVKIAMGGDKDNPNIIEVIDIACDECPVSGYVVTDACRGCIAHRCAQVCRRNAITFDENKKAIIDKSKCVECGMCAKVCPYTAIANRVRPCQAACKVKAIGMGPDQEAVIDYNKCIECGACVYQCPFGAIVDKSYILDAINILKQKGENKVYAIVAPSIAAQFSYVKLGQVIFGIKKLGFDVVVEAALGADMVADSEALELKEKGMLTSSCCPAFVKFIKNNYPTMVDKISHNLSPMATIAKFIKEQDENAKVIFIGPCTAKKMEFKDPKVAPYVDCVITFEELQALYDAAGIRLADLEVSKLDNASYFGRIFARSGGLTDAVKQALKEHNVTDFELKPVICNGIDECRINLLKASKGLSDYNFIEGMACINGCIGGAGCLTHFPRSIADVDKYGKEAHAQTIQESLQKIKL